MARDIDVLEQLWERWREELPPGPRLLLRRARVARTPGGEVEIRVPPGSSLILGPEDIAGRFAAHLAAARGERCTVRVREDDDLALAPAPQELPSGRPGPAPRAAAAEERVLFGRAFRQAPQPIASLGEGEDTVVVEGRVFRAEVRRRKGGGEVLSLDLTDGTDSITVKLFGTAKTPLPEPAPGPGAEIRVRGTLQYDRFSQEQVLVARDVMTCHLPTREDRAPERRVELHLHTKMSAMDACLDLEQAVARAARWGHPAIAVTDHGVVQAFPEAFALGQQYGIKIVYGLEAYLVDDAPVIVEGARPTPLEDEVFAVLDLETTALSPLGGEMVEIGAVRVVGGRIADRFHSFVRPTRPLPPQVVELTGITPAMVKDAPDLAEVLPRLLAFLGDAVIVAHNAEFDVGFLRAAQLAHGYRPLVCPVLDTLKLARALLPERKSHRLDALAAELGVEQLSHHRAGDDARVTAEILLRLLALARRQGCHLLSDLNRLGERSPVSLQRPSHATLLLRDGAGLKELYRLVSQAHLEDFHRVPRIRRSRLAPVRPYLLVGSGCDEGELVRAVLSGRPEEEVLALARWYDFVELQPAACLRHLVPATLPDEEALLALHRRLLEVADRAGVPAVATGNVHFLDPEDRIFRQILLRAQGGEGKNPDGELYLRTTEEMLAAFAHLGERAEEIVVANSRLLADRCAAIRPIPEGLHAPTLPGAAETVRSLAERQAAEWYGSPLPPVVAERLERELAAICDHGYAVIYLTAHRLVQKSRQDGYLVGSRGSVGSSLVATLCGITEVNPLPPHYRCPACRYTEFPSDPGVGSGFDLPEKACPRCGTPLHRDGQDIPFETFMGLGGDKVPDIDLNFSGENQAEIHRFAEELFGRDAVFRAGTVSTIAERTAFGFVRGYLEEQGRRVRAAEAARLAQGLVGVKRTTGQHPGGLIVLPKDREVYEFTPVQYPADDTGAGVITTHFEYSYLHDSLLKLDLLGHDDPTILRLLEEMTGVKATEVPLSDPKVLSLFTSTEALGASPEAIGCEVGTLGLPEFNTRFVRQMCLETRPRTFADLVRISGLSHGTDVWVNNAQDLVREGVCTLAEVIATRDDILTYLVRRGLPLHRAFAIMERVRKGKGLAEQDCDELRAHGVPEWYIRSCQKITYMFPKAHAAAYVLTAVRIAYYKVYHPEAFYAAYFTVRGQDFEAELAVQGEAGIRRRIKELEALSEPSPKDRNLLTILEVAREMYARGYTFRPVDLWESDERRFCVTPTGILPPLTTLPGLGQQGARTLAQARKEAPFLSVEDLRQRARLARNVVDQLLALGCLKGLPETNQLTLFG